ncbi:hypothetical protein V6Z11_D05G412700 [Gossypium hirsutum]
MDEMGVNELTFLQLESCNDMEFLIDTKNDQGSTVAFSNLVELNIERMASLKGLCNGVSPTRFLQNLKQVIIKDCEELQVIFQIDKLSERMKYQTPLLSNLTILNLHSLPKLKRIWEVKPSHRAIASLQSLKVVTIISCNNLKTIFSPCLALSMLHLQALQISDCNGLEQNHCWTKLKTLRIEDCRLLKYVFANTLSQGFPLLESLYLKYCPQLLQVFSSIEGRDVTGDHILLNVPFLKNLEVSNYLKNISFKKIKDICSIEIREVELVLRNMGNSRQLRNTDVPVLNEGCIVVGNHEEVFQVQCGYSFSSIKRLLLENLFEVRNLTTLTLIDCKKLRYIFSPMMARSLSHLEYLFIEGCEEIERLILAKDQVSSSSSNGDTSLQPMSFPNLTQIYVINCKKLNSLFPFGFVHVLPKLESLIVKRNYKLEQVFKLEDEVEVVAEEEMKFDKLKRLSLEELLGLIHFCPKGYHSVFPSMIELKVKDCPKLTTGFFIDSQEFVHCKTKVPQLVAQDAVEKSTTVRNAIFNENIDWTRGLRCGSQLPHIA